LTIKFTLDTSTTTSAPHRILAARCVLQLTCSCPSIFNCQRSLAFYSKAKTQHPHSGFLTPGF